MEEKSTKIKFMTGIELIAKERQEQIEKHKWTVDSDRKFNRNNQLVDASMSILCGCEAYRPKDWNSNLFDKIHNKPRIEKLAIAGALLAAEIDRINELELS